MLRGLVTVISATGISTCDPPRSLAREEPPATTDVVQSAGEGDAANPELAAVWKHVGRIDVPTGRPTATGGVVLWSTPRAIHAVRSSDGLAAWPLTGTREPIARNVHDGASGRGFPLSADARLVEAGLFDDALDDRGDHLSRMHFAADVVTGQGRAFAILRAGAMPSSEGARAPLEGESGGTGGDLLIAIDTGPAEGRVEWIAAPPTNAERFTSSPVTRGDRVLVIVGRDGVAPATSILCLHASDGRPAWSANLPFGDTSPSTCHIALSAERAIVATPDGIAAFGLDGRMAWTRAWSRETGKRSDPGVLPRAIPVLALASDRVVTSAPDPSRAVCLALDDGRTLWQAAAEDPPANVPIDDAMIDAERDQVIVAADGLFACRLDDGAVTSRYGRGGHRSVGRGIVANDVVYWPSRRVNDREAFILPLSAVTLQPMSTPIETQSPSALALAARPAGADAQALLIHAHGGVVEALLTPPAKVSP